MSLVFSLSPLGHKNKCVQIWCKSVVANVYWLTMWPPTFTQFIYPIFSTENWRLALYKRLPLETSIFHVSWNSCVEYVTRCCRGVHLAFFKWKEPSLKSVFKTSAILVSQDKIRQRNGYHVGDPNQSFVPIQSHHAAVHVSGKVIYRIAKICRAFGNAPGNALDITLLGRNSQLLFRKDREQFEFIRLQLLGGIWRRCIGLTLHV